MADRRVSAAALLTLFAFEAIVFYGQLTSQITPFYPKSFDQLQYLGGTYELLRGVYANGLGALWTDIFSGRWPQHATFSAQGALMALIGGPSRTAVVTLNLVYFLALQAMVFWTVFRKTSRLDLAWLAVGLLLTARSLFLPQGGMFDFRLDFGATCLFGIWTCAVLRTNGWRDLRWSIIAGFCAALLVSTRYITITYIIAIGAPMMLAVAVLSYRARSISRLRNISISTIVMVALVAPFLYASRKVIYAYYGIGHVLGPEKEIRAAEVGLKTLYDHLVFYPSVTLWHRLSTPFFAFAAAIAILIIFRRRTSNALSAQRPVFDLSFLALTLAGTYAVLTPNIAKSHVVTGVVLVPIILFIVLALSWLASSRRQVPGCAGAVVASAMVFTSNANVSQNYMPRADLDEVNRLNTATADYIVDRKLTAPHIAIDRVQDFLNSGTVRNVLQERDLRGASIQPASRIVSIFAISREDALAGLAASDIAILSDNSERGGVYPFNHSMREHWPAMNEYAEKNLSLLATGTVRGTVYRVYVRRPN